jgi:hypothetical protein
LATWTAVDPEAAGTCLDEDLLARLQLRDVDEGLPQGERDGRYRGRLLERQ